MKRTVLILGIIVTFISIFMATTGSSLSSGSNTTCCNIQFVVHSKNMPLANVTVTVPGSGGGSCTTNSHGECSICVSGAKGDVVAATISCGTFRKFQPCSTPVEVIDCP